MMIPETKIFGSGTMRSGGTLTCNILSVHSKIIVFSELVHFFRHIAGRYDPLDRRNVERMLHHQRIRLYYRFNIELDVSAILAAILARGVSYAHCYDEIMKHLLVRTGKTVWGDYATLHWRDIPRFLEMFPNAKAFHVYRDPRGLLSSWGKMTFMPDNLYLNCIFNWADSIQHMMRYRQTLPPERYLCVRFEDIHHDPLRMANELCNFVGVPFEDALVQPERWPSLFVAPFVEANVSSYTRQRTYGYDPARSVAWRNNLEEWEIALVEYLVGEPMVELGYEPLFTKIDPKALKHGMAKLAAQPFLSKNFVEYLATGEGTSARPNDPADPRNWGAAGAGFDKFFDTPAYADYQREMNEVEAKFSRDERYADAI